MAQKSASSGLSLAGKGFFGSLCAGTFGLGVWQTQRYFEKEELVAQRQQELSEPPLTHLSAFLGKDTGGGAVQFRRLQLQGEYLYEKECLVGPRGPPLGALPNKPGYASGGMAKAPGGYFVLTPLRTKTTTPGQQEATVVWVNRGWIPRHMADGDSDKHGRGMNRGASSSSSSSGVAATKPLLSSSGRVQWDRPTGPVAVTCVPSQPENPRFLVADHKLDHFPPKLFWMDLYTLSKLLQLGSSSSSSEKLVDSLVLTEVQQQQQQPEDQGEAAKAEPESYSFPLSPPARNVGDFKTSPMVHAGYAVTWYGLSMAGLYMTRMLIARR